MRALDKPVGRAWRGLRVQRFLGGLVGAWGIGLALAAIVLGVEKLGWPIPGEPWMAAAVAGGLGLIAAIIYACTGGPSRADAAAAIDRAFKLDERLASALSLPEDLRETSAGRALLADAARRAAAIDVGSKFGPKVPRRAWVPLVPAAIIAGLALPSAWTQRAARARPTANTPAEQKEVVARTKDLAKRLGDKRQQIDKETFAEADKLLAQIEKAAEDMAKAPLAAKDKTLVELNQLSDAVKDRRKQLGSPEQVDRQLKQLKEMSSSGPADDFAKGLARADFNQAAQALKDLKDKLASGKMTEPEKAALKEQLGEMKQQLQKVADMEERKKQLEEAKKNGGLSKEQFDKEMGKLQDQTKGLEKLKQLSEKLAEAEKQLAKGDTKKAAEALGMTEKQLADMAKQAQELEALDGALADLQDAKDALAGGGDGNRIGEGMDGMGNGIGNRMGMGNGQGRGRGQGQGDRPEAKDDVASYSTKVKPQIGKGKAILEGFAPPTAQTKGQSLIDIQGELETSAGLAAEALTNQKVPKNVEKHVRGYFDRLNKGR